jgi:hypothetical protein
MPGRIFPRLKGRKNVFPFFLFDYWVALFTGRCGRCSGRCSGCQTKSIPHFRFCRSTRHRRHDAVTFKRCIVTIVLLKDNSIRIRFLYWLGGGEGESFHFVLIVKGYYNSVKWVKPGKIYNFPFEMRWIFPTVISGLPQDMPVLLVLDLSSIQQSQSHRQLSLIGYWFSNLLDIV